MLFRGLKCLYNDKPVLLKYVRFDNYGTTSKGYAKKELPISNVTGLSSKVVDVPSGVKSTNPLYSFVGPGASKSGKYKNPEYFCYHSTSYFDAEIELAKFRLPQPSAKISDKK